MNDITILTNTSILDKDALEIGVLYESSNSSFSDAVMARLECGQLLAKKKASMKHGEWLPWLEANAGVLGFSDDSTARRLMKTAKSNRAPAHNLDEATAVALSRQMWGHKGEDNHLAQGTGENEWYTPAEYIALARQVMNSIDLDPASNADANKTVGAAKFYSIKDDGLAKKWRGTVWLNPPYSRDLMPKFVEKLKASFVSGGVTAAIMVAHNNTDTGWFHSLAKVAAAICFTDGRIKFYRGEDVAAPVNGQIFIYLGKNVAGFKTAFDNIGFVMVPA